MKVLSLNFLTCAVKKCKMSADAFPLHPRDAELVQDELEVNAALLVNVLPRLDWTALSTTSKEVSLCAAAHAQIRNNVMSTWIERGIYIYIYICIYITVMMDGCVSERERASVSVCVCVRERERERETE